MLRVASRPAIRRVGLRMVGSAPFDTQRVVDQLTRDNAFDHAQAKRISEVFRDVLAQSLEETTPKARHEELSQRLGSDLSHLKSEVLMLERSHYEKMVLELSKLSDRLNRVNEDMRSELERVKASNRLDQNLEKARMDGKLVELRSTIEKLENRLETHRSSTRSRISEVKFDVLRYCVGTLASLAALGLGFARWYMR